MGLREQVGQEFVQNVLAQTPANGPPGGAAAVPPAVATRSV